MLNCALLGGVLVNISTSKTENSTGDGSAVSSEPSPCICDANNLTNQDYIIMIPDLESDECIDVLHMSATLNRLFYTGTTSFQGIPTLDLLDSEVDALCGWAGDFQALIRDYFNAGHNYSSELETYNSFYPMIGDSLYFCSHSDIITDMDSCNLYNLLASSTITTGTQLKNVVLSYYNNINSENTAAQRFTSWIGSQSKEQLIDKISDYCDEYYILGVKWPILNSYTIEDYEQSAFTNAFVDYLLAQREVE